MSNKIHRRVYISKKQDDELDSLRLVTCAEDIPNTPPPSASNSREPTPVPHIESPLPDRDLDTDHADTQEQNEQTPPHERPLQPNTLPTAADMAPAAPIDIIPADTISTPEPEDTPDAPFESFLPPEPEPTATTEPLAAPPVPVTAYPS